MSKRMIDSELIESIGSLGNSIRSDEMGNVTIGKNLEVDGTTKLNGGIKPIRSFKVNNKTVDIYVESSDGYISRFFGKFDDKIGIGYCQQHNNGTIVTFYMLSESNNGLQEYNIDTNSWRNINLTINSKQPKLYRHILTMVANTEEGDPETSTIEYISTNNLKVASLQDLTTLLKPTANFIYPLGPVVNADLGGITDYNQLEYSNSVWKFAGPASNITKINVVSVSDTVTSL